MVHFTPRSVRNLALALLLGTAFVVTQTSVGATTMGCENAQTWCSGQQNCDPDWCGPEEGTCYALGGTLCQGCYEDAGCNSCAVQCAIPE